MVINVLLTSVMIVATPAGENPLLQLVSSTVAQHGPAAQPPSSNTDRILPHPHPSENSHMTATHLQAGHHEQVGDLCRVVDETVPVQQVNGAAAEAG